MLISRYSRNAILVRHLQTQGYSQMESHLMVQNIVYFLKKAVFNKYIFEVRRCFSEECFNMGPAAHPVVRAGVIHCI